MVSIDMGRGDAAPHKRRVFLEPLNIAIAASMVVGLGGLLALALRLTLNNQWLTVGALLCLAPATVVFALSGVQRRQARVLAAGTLGAVALLISTLLVERARSGAIDLAPAQVALILIAPLLMPVLGLWTAARAAHDGAKPPLPIFAAGGVSIVCLLQVAILAIASALRSDVDLSPGLLTGLYTLALAPAIAINWMQARREKRIPAEKSDKPAEHISGVSATGFLTFALVVIVLGVWAAATGVTERIDSAAGSIVIFGLAIAFVVLAVSPYLPPLAAAGAIMKVVRALVRPLGLAVSWIDSILVFPVAGALGASQADIAARYVLLLGNLVPCAMLGWWMPAPFGLLPLGAAVLGAFAIARRWAWVEEDRENAMLNRKFEGPHIRVGFVQDLRDETLIAFMTLLFLVPLAMRQLYFTLGADTFQIQHPGDVNNVLAWFSFFGTELAKALPFVDWAEVYHVEGDAPIHLDAARITAGNHVIFASRILVDLVLLAAFLQAISIVQRTKKLHVMFYDDQTIDQLDPFIEPAAFRKLVTRTANGLDADESVLRAFPHYNEDRLEQLRLRGAHDEIGFVAGKLLELYAQGGPEDQLVEQSNRRNPSREKFDQLIDELKLVETVRVGALKAAHFNLNPRTSLWGVRQAITELIASHADDSAAINALSEILIGPGPGVADARQEVRYAALLGLFKPALAGNAIARASIVRAKADQAHRVRTEAEKMSKEFGAGPAAPPAEN